MNPSPPITEKLLREALKYIGPKTLWQWTNDAGLNLHDMLLWALEARALLKQWVAAPDDYDNETMARVEAVLRGEVLR